MWHEIAATAETCLGSDCPQYQQCFVTRMRQRAAESDVVIVNHHLLCADAAVRQSSYGEVIPDCRHVGAGRGASARRRRDAVLRAARSATTALDELVRDGERLLNARRVSDADGELPRAVAASTITRARSSAALAMARRMRGVRRRAPAHRAGLVRRHHRRRPGARHRARRPRSGDGAGRRRAPRPQRRASNEDALTHRAARAARSATTPLPAGGVGHAPSSTFVETRGRGVFLRAAPIDVVGDLQGACCSIACARRC